MDLSLYQISILLITVKVVSKLMIVKRTCALSKDLHSKKDSEHDH